MATLHSCDRNYRIANIAVIIL